MKTSCTVTASSSACINGVAPSSFASLRAPAARRLRGLSEIWQKFKTFLHELHSPRKLHLYMLALALLALVLPACAQDEVRVHILSPAPGAVVTGGVVCAGRSLYVLAGQKVTVEGQRV